MTIVNSTEMQNNFGKFLHLVQSGEDIVIMKNGKEVARLISSEKAIGFLTDSLIGVLKNDYNLEQIKKERYFKYENID